jgi:hypothetical protein
LQNNSKPLLNVCVNGCFAAADLTLVVTAQTPSATLSTGQAVSLQAKATVAQGEVKRVWAVLKPPKINHLKDRNGTPILAFPRLTLSPTAEKTVWATSWEGAVYKGNYEIVFYAEDEQRNIASSEAVTLTMTDGPDSPAQPSLQWLLDSDPYQVGDPLKAQLIEHLGWGYDLYVAVVFPDGHFEALENTNRRLSPNQVQNWQPGSIRPQERPLTIWDEKIPDDWSAGQYCLYGILSPAGEPVLEENTKTMWVKAEQCFEVK